MLWINYHLLIASAVALLAGSYAVARAMRIRRLGRLDEIRYKLFAARDRLYSAAATGLVPVESKVFKSLRGIINEMIVTSEDAAMNELVMRVHSVMDSIDPGGDPHTAGAVARKRLLRDIQPEGQRECDHVVAAMGRVWVELVHENSRLYRWLILAKPRASETVALERRVSGMEKRLAPAT